jgi:glutamate synthase (NADPH/NADH) large chain
MVFLPVEPSHRLLCEGILERIAREEGLTVLGWRDTPVEVDAIGRIARASQPYIEQIFIGGAPECRQDELERKLYIVRKRAESEIAATDLPDKGFFYIPSLSSRTIVYKGLLLAQSDLRVLQELTDPDADERAVPGSPALLHQHVSVLAAGASLSLSVPQRRNQYHSRQHQLDERAREGAGRPTCSATDLKKLSGDRAGGSDSGSLDNAVELLTLAGRSLPHVMAMLIPEAWDADTPCVPRRRRSTNITRR